MPIVAGVVLSTLCTLCGPTTKAARADTVVLVCSLSLLVMWCPHDCSSKDKVVTKDIKARLD